MSVLFSFSTVLSVVSAFQSKPLIDEGILVATAAIVESWQTNSRRLADATRKREREREMKIGRSEKQRKRKRSIENDSRFVFILKLLPELIYLFLISDQHHTSSPFALFFSSLISPPHLACRHYHYFLHTPFSQVELFPICQIRLFDFNNNSCCCCCWYQLQLIMARTVEICCNF